MTLTRLRILTVHFSTFYIPISFTVMAIAGYRDPDAPWWSRLSIVLVGVAIMALSPFLIRRHLSQPCERCAELRPRIAPRIDSIENVGRRLVKQHRNHFRWWFGVGILVGALLFSGILIFFGSSDLSYHHLALGEAGTVIGLWWVAFFIHRHTSYFSHQCPWCALNNMRIIIRIERDQS